jgi:NAD(P)-dependent dehydrogenase (short-subunit alcohol dehydrogenase family)
VTYQTDSSKDLVLKELAGRVACDGCANRGIGRELARQLGQEGALVLIRDESDPDAQFPGDLVVHFLSGSVPELYSGENATAFRPRR